VAANLTVESARGKKRLNVMNNGHLDQMIEACRGARLVVLDTLTRFYGGLRENDNSEMAALMATLDTLAEQSGASILIPHHVTKSTETSEEQGEMQLVARGASAITDNARWVSLLTKMSKIEADYLSADGVAPVGYGRRSEFVKLCTPKVNYGPLDSSGRWYRRGSDGLLLPVDLVSLRRRGAQASNDAAINAKVAASRRRRIVE
jgi:hypothetical protein